MGQQDLIDINKDNLYDIIGVQHDATLKEIAKKYKKQALKLHPDKNPDPTAHQKFLKLTQILELLSDESSRNNYDIILKAREAARFVFDDLGKVKIEFSAVSNRGESQLPEAFY